MTDRQLVHGVALCLTGAVPLGVCLPIVVSRPTLGVFGPIPVVTGVLLAVAGVAGFSRLRHRRPSPDRRLVVPLAASLAGTVAGQTAVWLAPDDLLTRVVASLGGVVIAAGTTLVVAGLALLTRWFVIARRSPSG